MEVRGTSLLRNSVRVEGLRAFVRRCHIFRDPRVHVRSGRVASAARRREIRRADLDSIADFGETANLPFHCCDDLRPDAIEKVKESVTVNRCIKTILEGLKGDLANNSTAIHAAGESDSVIGLIALLRKLKLEDNGRLGSLLRRRS